MVLCAAQNHLYIMSGESLTQSRKSERKKALSLGTSLNLKIKCPLRTKLHQIFYLYKSENFSYYLSPFLPSLFIVTSNNNHTQKSILNVPIKWRQTYGSSECSDWKYLLSDIGILMRKKDRQNLKSDQKYTELNIIAF